MANGLQLRDVFMLLKRRWWLVVAIAIVVTALAYIVSPEASSSYKATTSLILQDQGGTSIVNPLTGRIVGNSNLSTQVQLITSPQVLSSAARRVLEGSAAEFTPPRLLTEALALESVISTRRVGESTLVVVSARGDTGDLAILRANSVAHAYIDHTTQQQSIAISENLFDISQQLTALRDSQLENAVIDPVRLGEIRDDLKDIESSLAFQQRDLESLVTIEVAAPSSADQLGQVERQLESVIASLDSLASDIETVQAQTISSALTSTVAQLESSVGTAVDSLGNTTLELEVVLSLLKDARLELDSEDDELTTRETQIGVSIDQILALADDIDLSHSSVTVSGAPTQVDRQAAGDLVTSLRGIRGALDVLLRQVRAESLGETEALVFRSLTSAEVFLQEATVSVQDSITMAELLSDTSATNTLTAQIDSAVVSVRSIGAVLGDIIITLPQVDTTALGAGLTDQAAFNEVLNRLTAAGVIIESALVDISLARATETDATTYSNLLAIEGRIAGISRTIGNIDANLTELTEIEPPIATNPWLDVALEQTAEASAMLGDISLALSEALARGGPIPLDSPLTQEVTSGIDRSVSILGLAARNLRVAQQGELDARRFNQYLIFIDRNDALVSDLAARSSEVSAMIEAPGSEDTLIVELLRTQQQLELDRLLSAMSQIRVTDPAFTAEPFTSDPRQRNTIVGSIGGLLLGLLAAVGIGMVDTRVRHQDDVLRRVDMPLLAVIPKIPKLEDRLPQLSRGDPASPFSEAFRYLRSGIRVAAHDNSAKVWLITSPDDGEGKTTVATNLARSLQMEKRRVLVIDANLKRPTVTEAFDLISNDGLGTSLRDDVDPLSFVQVIDGVHVLPAGQAFEHSADVLTVQNLTALLERAKQQYDVIIIDGPSVRGVAETPVLAECADGVVVVMRSHRTSYDAIQETTNALTSAGGHIFGTVLNGSGGKPTQPGLYLNGNGRLPDHNGVGSTGTVAESGTTAETGAPL